MSVGSILVRVARGIYFGFSYLTLAFIGVVLLVAPWWALRGIPAMAVLFAALGLWFDTGALVEMLARAPAAVRRVLVGLAVASHLVVGGWAVVEWWRPIDPAWTLLAGSEEWNDPLVVFSAVDGFVVHSGGGRVWARTGDDWRDLGEPPGGRAWQFHTAPDGALWTAPAGTARLDRRDPITGQWRSVGRPAGELNALAVGADEVLATVGGALHRLDMSKKTWSKVQLEGRVDEAAVGGATAVVLGRSWWSREGSGEWIQRTPSALDGWYYPAVGGGGWRYAWHSGMWSSDLRVAPPGRSFESRTPPAPDLRVVLPDPDDGARVIAGSWGQGVWGSEDGGATWSALGLERVQVRSLAVDWRRGVVCAASANTIWDRGVFCRELPHGQPSGGSEPQAPTGSP
ncbi:hypothetical protein [Nannocystis punicea]|uniref:Uncharacterized protein n=1 Tax=Nannocystis punicea TaxID=2995304 RepID=A0ABY7H3Q7_9BACT|nr:hypothetical protein [Nannocystis poenicansa]WAS93783.1 hypothetical protein O0S08_47225 [Nannocystis poenicansa]